MAQSVASSEGGRSANSFASSFSQRSFFGKLTKYELKRRFYEKLDDFKNRVLLHKEAGFIVYRARCSYSGGVVVLKGYSRESLTMQTRQRVHSEVTLLQRAQCPFIIKCFDAFEDQGWWWLVLENCAAGDLYHIVQASGPIQQEGWLVSQVLLPILQTLAYLHAEGIIHRDIKPEHVLFNSEKVAKLSGFLLSWDVNRFSYPKDMVGTLDYVAPEVFILNGPSKPSELTHYDYKVDIWGVGIMAYDMLVGQPPFNTDEPNATVAAILGEEVEYPDFLSDEAVDFIDQCLAKDPTKRPTARQLLAHPWVRAHLEWEAPEDWDDPIPTIDFTYYRFGHGDEELSSSDDEDEGRKRRWYNPMTWMRGRNSLDELMAEAEREQDRQEASLGGNEPTTAAAQGQQGQGQAQQAGRWKLGASLQNFARSMMPAGNRVAADVSQPAAGPGLRSGRGDGGDTSDDGEEVIDKVGSRLGPHKAGDVEDGISLHAQRMRSPPASSPHHPSCASSPAQTGEPLPPLKSSSSFAHSTRLDQTHRDKLVMSPTSSSPRHRPSLLSNAGDASPPPQATAAWLPHSATSLGNDANAPGKSASFRKAAAGEGVALRQGSRADSNSSGDEDEKMLEKFFAGGHGRENGQRHNALEVTRMTSVGDNVIEGGLAPAPVVVVESGPAGRNGMAAHVTAGAQNKARKPGGSSNSSDGTTPKDGAVASAQQGAWPDPRAPAPTSGEDTEPSPFILTGQGFVGADVPKQTGSRPASAVRSGSSLSPSTRAHEQPGSPRTHAPHPPVLSSVPPPLPLPPPLPVAPALPAAGPPPPPSSSSSGAASCSAAGQSAGSSGSGSSRPTSARPPSANGVPAGSAAAVAATLGAGPGPVDGVAGADAGTKAGRLLVTAEAVEGEAAKPADPPRTVPS